METLLYLVKINAFLAIFYLTYWLLFRNHTFFAWNRFYLLSSLIASLILPSIKFSETYKVALPTEPSNVAAGMMQVSAQQIQEQAIDWTLLVVSIYAIGLVVMLGRLLASFYKLFETIKNGEHLILDDYTLVLLGKKQLHAKDTGSFSFFKWMVVSKADYESNPDVILRHEHVHIRQLHSLDIILVELLKVAFWVNPALWFYKRSIQEVHEFLADQQIPDKDEYASFLVSYALNVPQTMVTNHFFNSSLLKSRIQMIYKNRTSTWLLGKYALIIPIAFLAVFLTAARERIPEPVKLVIEPAMSANQVLAQDETVDVKGTISDEKGNKIPDAIIILAGTTRGIASDKNGNFDFKQVPVNSKLAISHMQYKSVEIQIEKNKTTYNISLSKSIEAVTASNSANTEKSHDKFMNYKPGQLPESVQKPYTVVEQKPQFPGGYEGMMAYLSENLKYPEPAFKANVEGIAILRFTVNEEGEVGNVVIVKGVGFGIDMESVRLVKNMPKWEPGIQNGKPLEMAQTIEIKFDLEKAKQKTKQGFLEMEKSEKSVILPTMTELGMYFNKFIDFSGNRPTQKLFSQVDSTKKVAYTSNYRFMNYGVTIPPYSTKFQKKPSMITRQVIVK